MGREGSGGGERERRGWVGESSERKRGSKKGGGEVKCSERQMREEVRGKEGGIEGRLNYYHVYVYISNS